MVLGMTITAKHATRCPRCRQPIAVGERVEWQRGQKATHLACPEADFGGPSSDTRWDEGRDDAPTSEPVTEVGVYERDGQVYVVKPNREKTRLYAKRLIEINAERLTEAGEVVEIEFEYAPGAIFELTPADKMDLERAKALTIRYGRCIVCGRKLKAAKSVERAIGPVCIKSFAP